MSSAALSLHGFPQGQGPSLVLSHALGADLGMWDEVAPRLARRFTVWCYDQRGHGQSPTLPGPHRVDDLADDVAHLITTEVGGPVHFVGLSMGGMVAQALAVRHPELLKSLVLANTTAHYDDAARALIAQRVATVRQHGLGAIAEGMMQRWFTPAFSAQARGAGRVAATRACLEATSAEAYAASAEAVAAIDFRESNRRITCPVLVLAGLHDQATPLAAAQALADGIPGARLRTLDAAHLSAVEQPEAFAALVTEFLDPT